MSDEAVKPQTARMYAYKELAIGDEKVVQVAKAFKDLSQKDQDDLEEWAEAEMRAKGLLIKAASE